MTVEGKRVRKVTSVQDADYHYHYYYFQAGNFGTTGGQEKRIQGFHGEN
jgi:hypothetical protein